LSRGPAFSESLAFRVPRGKHGYSLSSEWIESGVRRRDSPEEGEREREDTWRARGKGRNAFWRFEEYAGERENSIRGMKLGAESEKELSPENVYRRCEKWHARISHNVTAAYACPRRLAKFKGNVYEMKRGCVAHRVWLHSVLEKRCERRWLCYICYIYYVERKPRCSRQRKRETREILKNQTGSRTKCPHVSRQSKRMWSR